jgi:hypothetical protein
VSFSGDLMAGVAQILEDASVGTWKPAGAYLAGDPRPIFMREGPSDRHQIIVIAHYPVLGAGRTRDTVEGIQVRNRGTPGDTRPADDDADAIREALDGLEHVVLGGRHVSLIRWQSGASLGQDGNKRWETSQNFYLFTARPSAHLED